MLPVDKLVKTGQVSSSQTNHARAWEGIPAESDSIAILNFAPLVLQRFVVHVGGLGNGVPSLGDNEGTSNGARMRPERTE